MLLGDTQNSISNNFTEESQSPTHNAMADYTSATASLLYEATSIDPSISNVEIDDLIQSAVDQSDVLFNRIYFQQLISMLTPNVGMPIRRVLRLYPYHNHRTFLHLESSLSIPPDDLLVLDGYAFSVEELTEYATHSLKDFYRNPHITQADENTSFSDAAITKLRRHPTLSQFAKALDEQLALQMNGISDATIDAVLVLLNAHGNDDDAVDEAERKFGQYFFTLNSNEQARLNAYIIRVQNTSGSFQAMTFEYALLGGSRFDRCTYTQQIYLWQFVIDFRPTELQNIPPRVLMLAQFLTFEIKARVSYASSMSLEEKPAMDSYIPSSLAGTLIVATFQPMQLFHNVQLTLRQPRQSGHAVYRSMELEEKAATRPVTEVTVEREEQREVSTHGLSDSHFRRGVGSMWEPAPGGGEGRESIYSNRSQSGRRVPPSSIERPASVSSNPFLLFGIARQIDTAFVSNDIIVTFTPGNGHPFIRVAQGLQGAAELIRTSLIPGVHASVTINGRQLDDRESEIFNRMLGEERIRYFSPRSL